MTERVVVTAVSAICALGADVGAAWAALREGATGISDAGPRRWPAVGPVAAVALADVTGSALAVRAVRALGPVDPDGLAVVGASTAGDMVVGEDAFARHLRGEPVDPDQYLWSQPCHRPTVAAARALGATGPTLTMSTACTSGASAIGVALDLLRSGRARRVVAFGTDALCGLTTSGFAALGLHSATACRPFDVDRDGMCLGEGAAALLLERHPVDREPLAEVLGFGTAVDAHHLSTPDPEARGAIAAMGAALGESGVAPADVGYVNAHGTGTVLNDAMEALALARVVPHAPVSSTKGATGHTLGAAGALEAVFAVLALRDGVLPPNVGVRTPVPGLDLVRQPRRVAIRTAMSVNFAFGGHNTALVFGRAA